MKKVILFFIVLYRTLFRAIFGIKGSHCKFQPTCSQYTLEAFEKYSFFEASKLSIKRILSCHPWSN